MKRLMSQMVTWIGVLTLMIGCSTTGAQPPAQSAAAQAEVEKAKAADEAQAQAVAKLREMMADGKAYTNEQILPLYDQLDPVDIDFMIGTWKGGKFDGGKLPDPINWYGKRFQSANAVDPLLARKPDGTVYSFDKWGMAMLREVKYRDKVSATLIYNIKPIMDYFRKIDDNTLLGFGEMSGRPTFFFYLTRDEALALK